MYRKYIKTINEECSEWEKAVYEIIELIDFNVNINREDIIYILKKYDLNELFISIIGTLEDDFVIKHEYGYYYFHNSFKEHRRNKND